MATGSTRREFVSTMAAATGGLGLGLTAGAQESAGKRPNILWIISEDTGPEFGCYDYPLVHTPNVDGIAEQGVCFTSAFTATPVCSTSRSSFMTGMYATSIGAHNHRSHRGDGFKLPEGVHVFTKYLRDAGYFTALPGGRKTDWNFAVDEKPYDSFKWDDLKDNQPFFAQYQFSETHRKFKRCLDHPVDPAKVGLPPYYPDHPVARQDWAMYLETVNVLDQKIGEVLARLEEDGLADNTIVFYFGDHGRAHVRGKQWLYDGGIRIPLVIKWPDRLKPGTVRDDLVSAIDFAPTCLKLAGVEPPAHMQGRVFLGDDEAPSPEMVFATRDRCDETVDRIRCVRTKRYKYIRNFMPERPYTQKNAYKERAYPMLALMRELHAEGKLTPEQQLFMAETRPAEELFDVQADPWEVKNLAGSPEHQDELKRLRAALDKWIVDTDDKGRTPESKTALDKAGGRKQSGGKTKPTGEPGKRLAPTGLLDRQGWRVAFVDSAETAKMDQKPEKMFDGNPMTCWHTEWSGKRSGFPHEVCLDLGAEKRICGLRYLPRQDRARNGRIRACEVYVSADGKAWGNPVLSGEFKASTDEQEMRFGAVATRYLRLLLKSGHDGDIAAISELNLVETGE